ncbi:MAG: tetratricopeptide repeat protein [Pseudomonadota bacterium]
MKDPTTPSEQFLFGENYLNGTGVEQNAAEAVRFYRLAAAQGYAPAQCNLGTCLINGTGVEKNAAEAVNFYRLAAAQGLAPAQYHLGICLDNGTGVEKNAAEAVRFYRLAAAQGYAPAQCNLGTCLINGTGVEKNAAEAVNFYRLAAAQGNAPAQYNLGVCLGNGTGVKKNAAEAVSFYRLAAAQGYAPAQYNLGVCLRNGTGVEKDSSQAILLFVLAYQSGQPYAKNAINAKKLSGSHFIQVDLRGNNTPLNAEQLLNIISSEDILKRISNNNSRLIGDLVSVSQSVLSGEDLSRIRDQLLTIPSLDEERSKSCLAITKILSEQDNPLHNNTTKIQQQPSHSPREAEVTTVSHKHKDHIETL